MEVIVGRFTGCRTQLVSTLRQRDSQQQPPFSSSHHPQTTNSGTHDVHSSIQRGLCFGPEAHRLLCRPSALAAGVNQEPPGDGAAALVSSSNGAGR